MQFHINLVLGQVAVRLRIISLTFREVNLTVEQIFQAGGVQI